MKKHISYLEYLFVSFFIMLIFSISIICFLTRDECASLKKRSSKNKYIEVHFDGAIVGDYRFKKGMTLRNILKKMNVDKCANLKICNLNKKIFKSTSVFIPLK
jgi:hypothetical protein